ncbi:MAG: hypothetical protein EOO73_08475 [Myxococcales bacterium]|nr:MAG: hypothetical protein EOO73_08475 [Myxococcales bacterium]
MRAGVAAVSLSLLGCGREDLELLERVQRADPCLALVSEAECDGSAARGCSFQPNERGCLSTDASCQPGQCRGGDPFVRRVERSFFLNGAPFRFVGVSSWALLPATSCSMIKPEQREAWITQAYDGLVASDSKVARFYAFQSAAGPSGEDFTLLDSAIRAARRAGVRVLLTLDHAGGECTQGVRRDDAWYAGGFRSPDGEYPRSYRDYVEAVARRYRDEPTVLGYTMLQSLGGVESQTLSAFVTEIGQLLHGVAPNQLVSLDAFWDATPAYVELQRLPVVDFVDIDDYDFSEPEEPLRADLLEALAQVDKPAVVGEGAFRVSESSAEALENRAARARGRMAEWNSVGLNGALFWAYQPGWSGASEEFDARAEDPLLQPAGVLASAPW